MPEVYKHIFRKVIRPVLYVFYYLPFRKQINVTRNGQPLKQGITAVVAMKNEEYTLPFCLQSLIGFADQIVIIDNGSEDASLEKAKTFQQEFGSQTEVDIIEMPNALLGDCREAGLKATRYQWHLRWDADMVAHTTGDNDIKLLRQKILQDNTPRAIQLPRINIFGDLHHTMGIVSDPGEPILIWFTKHIRYQEFGKFDSVKIPFYYKQDKETKNYYFHCSGLKSDENLIHRFHYFVWREYFNTFKDYNRPNNIQNFDDFKRIRNKYLFDTNNSSSLKFRYQRQLVSHFSRFNSSVYSDYPAILKTEIQNTNNRFEVVYKNNSPYMRIDRQDNAMTSYVPSNEDLNWSISDFFKKLSTENIKNYI